MARFRGWRRSSDSATCAEVMRHLQSYIDGEIQDELAVRRIAAHLETCRRCGLEVETYRRLKKSLRSMGPLDAQAIARLGEFAKHLSEQLEEGDIELG